MTLGTSALALLADAGAAQAAPTVLKSLPHHAVFLLLLQIAVRHGLVDLAAQQVRASQRCATAAL